ncbi:MAG: nucleotidyltransferase family protein [Bradyrhizobium sp.]|uniref:nucleotidyltransferase family protein n=1 Tax=Bradyrhizobium sp. TaxID=376 RepID=UPI001E05E7D5|nr:nucleotidyltransferase family protein [Bradyrhizobium sp.]MBV9560889.1 nucleotidyltransferase family protein [Bradyrhizobium sp.]
MGALLLAAGFGSRLLPITATTAKCLVPIDGKPLLNYWLEHMFAADIERILINTHWLAEQVVAHVRASRFASRIDLTHEDELLGTGSTVLDNRDWFRGSPFLVAHADNLSDFDVRGLVAAHETRPRGHPITMLGFRTDRPSSCGILELDDRSSVVAFHEKVADPPGNLANGAVYIFEPEIIDAIASLGRPQVDLSTEIIPLFLGRILCVETHGYHRDIGTPDSLAQARSDFAARRRAAEASTHRLQKAMA